MMMIIAGEFWACDASYIYMKLLMNVPSKCSQPNIPVTTPAQLTTAILSVADRPNRLGSHRGSGIGPCRSRIRKTVRRALALHTETRESVGRCLDVPALCAIYHPQEDIVN
jgi:hypothetical protein